MKNGILKIKQYFANTLRKIKQNEIFICYMQATLNENEFLKIKKTPS